jgi:hypothetical protein
VRAARRVQWLRATRLPSWSESLLLSSDECSSSYSAIPSPEISRASLRIQRRLVRDEVPSRLWSLAGLVVERRLRSDGIGHSLEFYRLPGIITEVSPRILQMRIAQQLQYYFSIKISVLQEPTRGSLRYGVRLSLGTVQHESYAVLRVRFILNDCNFHKVDQLSGTWKYYFYL